MLRCWLIQICEEQGIEYEVLSFGWVYRLSKNGRVRHVFGHHMDGNSAAADRIACDKYACYSILKNDGLPVASHEIIFDPVNRSGWMGEKGALKQAFEYFNAYAQKAVIKPNEGWQGQDVYLCETVAQVEQALLTIFKQDKNACICPFYPIENEYRVFYVYGECPVAYGKKRPSDSWKHNLTGGATAFDIQDEGLLANLRTLARKAAASINISFATVDIIQLTDGSLLILEINAGVSARKLLEQLPHHKDKIKDLYAQAVGRMFE